MSRAPSRYRDRRRRSGRALGRARRMRSPWRRGRPGGICNNHHHQRAAAVWGGVGWGRADLIQSEAMAEADMMPQFSLWLTSDALVRPLRTSSGVEKGIPSGPSARLGVRRGVQQAAVQVRSGGAGGRGGQGVLTGAVVGRRARRVACDGHTGRHMRGDAVQATFHGGGVGTVRLGGCGGEPLMPKRTV